MVLKHLIVFYLILFSFVPAHGMEVTEELYSFEKQYYNPVYFRQRTLTVAKTLADEFTQTIPYKEVKRYNIYIPNMNPVDYPTKEMNEKYSDEKILYLTQKCLENSQVFIVSKNIYRQDGTPYSSSIPINEETGVGDMIVMDELGNIFIHPKEKGILHHSSFFSGRPLAFAGLCYIQNSWLKELMSYSGHYTPGIEELHNGLEALSQSHLKRSMYKVIEKNKQPFYVIPCGHESTFSICEDFGHLYVTMSVSANVDPALMQIDLLTGARLACHILPTSWSGMVKTRDHVTVLGMEKNQSSRESWIHSFHLSSGEVCRLSFPHVFTAIEPLGTLKGNRVATFIGDDYSSVISVNPEEGTISTKTVLKSGKLQIIGGVLMSINDYKISSKKGEITLFGEDDGKIILESVKFPRIQNVDRKIFYKSDKTCLAGYDLENNIHFLHAHVPSKSFSENFIVATINGQIWLFDHANNSLQAYNLNGSVLSLQWSSKNPSAKSFSRFNETVLSVDKTYKKLWGVPPQSELDKVCCWDMESGHLEYCETLNLGTDAQIVSFHKDGTPIVHTTDPL